MPVKLKNWAFHRRAVATLPEVPPAHEVLQTLEKELGIAQQLAIILADRAKRASVKMERSEHTTRNPGAKGV